MSITTPEALKQGRTTTLIDNPYSLLDIDRQPNAFMIDSEWRLLTLVVRESQSVWRRLMKKTWIRVSVTVGIIAGSQIVLAEGPIVWVAPS